MLTPDLPGYGVLAGAVSRAASRGVLHDLGTPCRGQKEMAFLAEGIRPARVLAWSWHAASARRGQVDGCADLERLPFRDASLPGAVVLEVIEHVADPAAAVSELHRVLRDGAGLVVTVPFLRGWHGRARGSAVAPEDAYPDYWRFTHEGLARLFSRFARVEVHALTGRYGDLCERMPPAVRGVAARVLSGRLARELADPSTARRLLVEARK